jgi:hypothetical protein
MSLHLDLVPEFGLLAPRASHYLSCAARVFQHKHATAHRLSKVLTRLAERNQKPQARLASYREPHGIQEVSDVKKPMVGKGFFLNQKLQIAGETMNSCSPAMPPLSGGVA